MNTLNTRKDPTPGTPPADEAALPSMPQSYFVECGVCGYEPPDQIETPKQACPKCNSRQWRRLYAPEYRAVRGQAGD